MENEKNTAFRNAISGYNKTDVKEYIAKMAEQASRRADAWETERGKLLREAQDERTEKEQIAAQRDEMACQLYAALSDIKEKETALEAKDEMEAQLKASVAGLSARIHELECALAKKSEELAAVEDAVGIRKIDSETDDALCDRLSEKVEKIMAAAGKSAEEIVTSALSRSDEIIAEAEKKAEKIRCDAVARSDEITGKAKADYKTAAADYYDEVMLFAAEIRDSLNRLMMEIGAKKTEVENKIEYMRPSMEPKKLQEAPSGEKETLAKDGGKLPVKETTGGAVCAMDRKIESLFKNTIHNINSMSRKKK